MFVFTMNKNGLKKAAVVVGCAALLVLSAVVVSGAVKKGDAKTTALTGTSDTAKPGKIKVKTTDDMVTYLVSMGVEADISTAKVDKVKVPKKWDDSFVAFNEVIKQSGLDLSKYKGKTVEKWDFVAPNKSTETDTVSAILLVYKKQVIGAYLIGRPSGEVSALTAPVASPAPSAAPTEGQPEGSVPTMTDAEQAQQQGTELTPEQLAQVSAAAQAAGLTDEQIAAAAAAIEAAAQAPDALPSE